MAQNITFLGAEYSDVPAVTLPKTGGGTATFIDVTDTTATASDVFQGKYFYTADGTLHEGNVVPGGAVVVTDEEDPGGGIIKHITSDVVVSGTLQITSSGVYDVSRYAFVEVNIPGT